MNSASALPLVQISVLSGLFLQEADQGSRDDWFATRTSTALSVNKPVTPTTSSTSSRHARRARGRRARCVAVVVVVCGPTPASLVYTTSLPQAPASTARSSPLRIPRQSHQPEEATAPKEEEATAVAPEAEESPQGDTH